MSSISVAELRDRAEQAHAAAVRLNEEADKLEQFADEFESNIENIDGLLSGLGGHSSNDHAKKAGRPVGSKNKPGKKPGRPSKQDDENETSLKDLILQVLKSSGKSGLPLKDIVRECIERGYKSKTMTKGNKVGFHQIVSSNLYNLTKKEHQVKRDKESKHYSLVA